MHMHCLLLCALEKDPTHFLVTFSRKCHCSRLLSFGKFTSTVSKHFYENYCTLFPALKQKEVIAKCFTKRFGLSALMQLSIITFGVGFYILYSFDNRGMLIISEHFSCQY